jgi:D-alanyl-D-alanine carboxypeptidase
MKKTVALIISVFTVFITAAFSFVPSASAVTVNDLLQPQNLPWQELTAHSVMVMNQVTGEVIFEHKADDAWVPASLTKLTTAQVVLDQKSDMNKLCPVTTAHDVGGAKLYVNKGAKYRMGDLFSAMLVASANNAANALAACTGLSREQFLAKMNAKAKQLGATSTTFVDPAGISEHNISTATDMAKIANAAFSTKKIRDVMAPANISICSKAGVKKCHSLKNTNQLLTDNSVYTLGGKTGYLDESRYNFATSLKQNGNYTIIVVMGSSTKSNSFVETKKVASWAFQKLALQNKVLAIKR